MLTKFFTLLSFVLTLILIIGLHELGHAFAALYFKIPINRISIGFGKPLWQFKSRGGIKWVWGRWPLGGYVALLNTRTESVPKEKQALAFDKRPLYQRLIVLLAGSFINLIMAWICLVGFYLLGHAYPKSVIKVVLPHSIAAKAGISAPSELITLNHQATPSWSEANIDLVRTLGEKHVSLTFRTQTGMTQMVNMDLSHLKIQPINDALWQAVGIVPDLTQVGSQAPLEIVPAALAACHQTLRLGQLFIAIISKLVLGQLPISLLLGPFQFLALNYQAYLSGLGLFLHFIATLSLATGIINLLPLPGLDGSLMVYACIEKITKKTLSVPLEQLLYRLTIIALSVFFVQLILNDITRFWIQNPTIKM